MEPWGTPFLILYFCLFISMQELFSMNFRRSSSSSQRKFLSSMMFSSFWWGTVSKAALKSIKIIPWFFLSFILQVCIKLQILYRFISVPRVSIKPVWALFIFFEQYCFILWLIYSSRNFLIGERTVIGLMSLIVGVCGCILLISTSLPHMWLMKTIL